MPWRVRKTPGRITFGARAQPTEVTTSRARPVRITGRRPTWSATGPQTRKAAAYLRLKQVERTRVAVPEEVSRSAATGSTSGIVA